MMIEVYSNVDMSFKETKILPTYRPTGAMIRRFVWLLNLTSIEGVSSTDVRFVGFPKYTCVPHRLQATLRVALHLFSCNGHPPTKGRRKAISPDPTLFRAG